MTDLIENSKIEPDVYFSAMAQRIIHNSGATFGGAAVIVSPSGKAQVELLMLDEAADEAQFWATIKTRIEIRIAELNDMQRNQRAFGR